MPELPRPAQPDDAAVHESVGQRIKHRRRSLRLTLKAVAARAGISESYLSQIERGLGSPNVRTLNAIARALDVQTRYLFMEDKPGEAEVVVVDQLEGRIFGDGASKRVLTPNDNSFLQVLMGVFPPLTSTGESPYTHGDSEELLYILSGTFVLELGDRTIPIKAGSCIGYRSSIPHKLQSTSDHEGRVLWITAPLS